MLQLVAVSVQSPRCARTWKTEQSRLQSWESQAERGQVSVQGAGAGSVASEPEVCVPVRTLCPSHDRHQVSCRRCSSALGVSQERPSPF